MKISVNMIIATRERCKKRKDEKKRVMAVMMVKFFVHRRFASGEFSEWRRVMKRTQIYPERLWNIGR